MNMDRATELYDAILSVFPDTYWTEADVQNAVEAASDDVYAFHGVYPDVAYDRDWSITLEPALQRLGIDYDELYEVAP